MGLHKSGLQALLQLFKQHSLNPKNVVTFGTQTIDCSLFDTTTLLLKNQLLKNKTSFAEVNLDQKTFDGNLLFQALGCDSITNIDVLSQGKDTTVLHNLGTPVPAELHQKFDFLFDGSTGPHCLNRVEALLNVVRLLKTDGTVVHSFGCDISGGAFGPFSLQLLTRFYEENGFGDFEIYLCHTKHLNGFFKMSGNSKLAFPLYDPLFQSILFSARKVKTVPVQTDFIEWNYELAKRVQGEELNWDSLQNKKVLIWGAGGFTQNHLLPSLNKNPQIQVLGLIDDDLQKQNTTILGHKILSSQALNDFAVDVVLLGSQNKKLLFGRLMTEKNLSLKTLQNTYNLYQDYFDYDWSNRCFDSHRS